MTIMNKEQAIQLARSYVTSWKTIKERGDYLEDDVMCLLQVYDYIFGNLIFDLNKFIDNDLVKFTVATDVGLEVIKLNLEEYLNSDLFYNLNN